MLIERFFLQHVLFSLLGKTISVMIVTDKKILKKNPRKNTLRKHPKNSSVYLKRVNPKCMAKKLWCERYKLKGIH